MKARTSESFAQCIVKAIRTGSSVDLEASLQEIGFTPGDSGLIAFAVRITRPDLAAPDGLTALALNRSGRHEPTILDALDILFIFNGINRIANAFGVSPEWSWCRRGERIRRATRPMISLLMHLLTSRIEPDQDNIASVETDLRRLLSAVGYEPTSPVCALAERNPDLALTLRRLLLASVAESQLGEPLELTVARACLTPKQDASYENGGPAGANESGAAVAPLENADAHEAIHQFAERLFSHPYTVSKQDLNELRLLGLDDGKLLDVVFRVAILAGLDKLAAVAQSIPELLVPPGERH